MERLTKRSGNFVFINTDVLPRTNCKGEYGFKFCQYSNSCPSIVNRKCPVLKIIDKLAEYEDKAEKCEIVDVVLCKDCKHYQTDPFSKDGGKVCRAYDEDHYVDKYDFCSYGIRKEQK